jgi:hypothetical protein
LSSDAAGRVNPGPGIISGRVREGYETFYVSTGVGMTYRDNGRELRRAVPTGADIGLLGAPSRIGSGRVAGRVGDGHANSEVLRAWAIHHGAQSHYQARVRVGVVQEVLQLAGIDTQLATKCLYRLASRPVLDCVYVLRGGLYVVHGDLRVKSPGLLQ